MGLHARNTSRFRVNTTILQMCAHWIEGSERRQTHAPTNGWGKTHTHTHHFSVRYSVHNDSPRKDVQNTPKFHTIHPKRSRSAPPPLKKQQPTTQNESAAQNQHHITTTPRHDEKTPKGCVFVCTSVCLVLRHCYIATYRPTTHHDDGGGGWILLAYNPSKHVKSCRRRHRRCCFVVQRIVACLRCSRDLCSGMGERSCLATLFCGLINHSAIMRDWRHTHTHTTSHPQRGSTLHILKQL